MRICIPSYDRYKTINDKSLKLLDDSGYDPKEIDLFVANQEQYDKYKEVVHPDINIIIGVKGLRQVREFIFNYYEEGQKLLCLDDDVRCIRRLVTENEKPKLEVITNLKEEVDKGFRLCEEKSLKLWGIYPCPNNAFWMKDEITYNYKFIVSQFFGCFNCKQMNQISVDELDDYERSIQSYLLYGGSVRLNYLAPKTIWRTGDGGAQTDPDRDTKITNSMNELVIRYPKLLYLRKRKVGYNPILKDLRKM